MNNQSNIIKNFRIILIRAPPRIGKTRWCVQRLVEVGEGNYITHRHSIVEHALTILKQLNPKIRAVVRLKGKYQEGMCVLGEYNCDDCPLKPDEHKTDHIGHFVMEDIAKELLKRYGIIDEKLVLDLNLKRNLLKSIHSQAEMGLCPYYTLMYVEKAPECKYCFTVVHFADRITPRKLLVIDETPTIQHFYPRSIELCDITLAKESTWAEITLSKYVDELKKVEGRIEKKLRRSQEDKQILELIKWFKELNDSLDARVPESLLNFTIKLPQIEVDEEAVLDKITEYTYPTEYDPSACFEALLYPFHKPFLWVKSENNRRHTLYLVGDASKPTLHTRILDLTQHIILVGGIEAELFAKQIADEKEIYPLRETEFPYKKNFIVIPIDAESNKQKKDEWWRRIRRRNNLIKILKQIGPCIVFTGSKRKAEQLFKQFKTRRYLTQDDDPDKIEGEYELNNRIFSWAGSKISRGLDIPFIHICAIIDADFVNPYWQARLALAKEKEDKEEKKFVAQILQEIVAEETTNMALRISPVSPNDLQPRVILIPRDELWKLRYLEGCIVDKSGNHRLQKIIKMVKEIGGERFERMKADLLYAPSEKMNEYIRELKEAHSSGILQSILCKNRKERASFWQQMVKKGSLTEAYNTNFSESIEEVDDKIFDIIISHVYQILSESSTRISQNRLIGKIRKYYSIDQNKLVKILEEGCKRRTIKREKVGRKWMYFI